MKKVFLELQTILDTKNVNQALINSLYKIVYAAVSWCFSPTTWALKVRYPPHVDLLSPAQGKSQTPTPYLSTSTSLGPHLRGNNKQSLEP